MTYQPHSEMTLPGRYTTIMDGNQTSSHIEMDQVNKKGLTNEGFDQGKNADCTINLPEYDGQPAKKTISQDDLLRNEKTDSEKSSNGGETGETCFQIKFLALQKIIATYYKNHRQYARGFILAILFIAYNVYWGYAIHLSWDDDVSWCEGVKFLTIINICAYSGLLYFLVLKRYLGKTFAKNVARPFSKISKKIFSFRYSSFIMLIIVIGSLIAFVLVDAKGNNERLISVFGIIALLAFGFIFSKHPHKIIIRHVTWGILLQFLFALCILRWDVGKSIFDCLGNKITTFLGYTDYGSTFIFGYLVDGKLNGASTTIKNLADNSTTLADLHLPQQFGVFAFKVLPVVAFFSFFTSILYYYGIMQWIVIKVGWILQITVGTTAAESMNASANIFMGQTEAPLLIRPYLPLMTKSELHAVMTGGFATIAGAVMAAYINLGINASHLLSASVMSAPAALAYSKLFYPETEQSKTTVTTIRIEKGKEYNALEAALNGITVAVTLMANIAANLIAFIAFIYFLDGTVSWFGSLVDHPEVNLTSIMAKIFMPVAYLMGVQWKECEMIGQLLGIKTILNEFVAYDQLGKMKGQLSERSVTIATYALCGFSNFASIGIQLGGLGAMAPNRIKDLAEIAFRALIAGSAACFMTACVAGAMMTESNYVPS